MAQNHTNLLSYRSQSVSSVAQPWSIIYDPIDCIIWGFPVPQQLPVLNQTHVHWVSNTIQPSHPLLSLSPPAFNISQYQGFYRWVSSSSGGQSIGVSTSASVRPINDHDWFPVGWTDWISLLYKGHSGVFSNTTVQKHQFLGAQLSLQSIHTWPLEKP